MFGLLFWAGLIVAGSVGINHWLTQRDAPRILEAGGGIELQADQQAHYWVNGAVNGREILFLVDTGASDVAIPAQLADSLGLRAGRKVVVQTANGQATARSTTIERLTIGPLERRDVSANIVPGMQENSALLGMSFLRHFDLLQRDGRLVLTLPE